MKRRKFIKQSSLVSAGFFSLQSFVSQCVSPQKEGINYKSFPSALSEGYGPLKTDPDGILELPEGFRYKIISSRGNPMSDGLLVPGNPDGMAAFPGENGNVILIRNHEVSPGDNINGSFGEDMGLLSKVDKAGFYDFGKGEAPGLGGTTTVIYDPVKQAVISEHLSLAGTIRNCAGGPTPWGSWITCEETTLRAGDILEKDHGYNFEVPAGASLVEPIPITQMGRFNHEAVCVHPETGIVYQTEDRHDGLIYRYLPKEKGKLHKGGKLQVLVIKDKPSFDTRNWKDLETERMEISRKYDVVWQDIDGIDAPDDDLRLRGFEQGAARFARGEGMWYGNDEVYFACTNGGYEEHGQVFRYIPSPKEGQIGEKDSPGQLEIFVEPNNTEIVSSCDNVTVAGNGHIVLCEDQSTPRIVGISPEGEMYHIARNVGYKSEFAGSVFSPDGSTLFVNIQGPGLTLAITGPWERIG